MYGNLRLRRTRTARGVMNLDMEALRKRQEQRMAAKDGPLSARSSPGSGKSSGKSTSRSNGRPSPDTPRFPRPQPPSRDSFSSPPRPAFSIPPTAPGPFRTSRPTAARPDITETPSRPPPPATTEASSSSVPPPPPPRITTTASTIPPPVSNAGDPQSPKSPDSPKTTNASSYSSSSSASTMSTISSSTSISSISSTSSRFSTSNSSTLSTSAAMTSAAPSSAPPVRNPVATTTAAVGTPASSSRMGSSPGMTSASTSRSTMPSLPLSSTVASQKSSAAPSLVPLPTGTPAPSAPPLDIPAATGAEPLASEISSTIPPSETSAATPAAPLNGGGSESSAMAGITVGTIAGVSMLAALVFFFFKRYKRRQAFLEQPYGEGPRDMSGGGRQPTIFATIQERFHSLTGPASYRINEMKQKGLSGGNNSQARGMAGGTVAGAGVGGMAAAGAVNVDPKTQSQIINEMFQAAYAAENGMGDRNSAYSSGYPVDKAGYYGQQEVPEGTIRESISKWLRGSSVNPLQQNPARDSSQSRFTAPSWTRSSTASSMLSEGDGVTSGVNSGLFPAGFRPASPLPPVPPIPPPNMQSRWSESTRAPPETPSVSHDSLYSMYKRDTQISGSTDSVVPEVPEWWRNEKVNSGGLWDSEQRASGDALGFVGVDRSSGIRTPMSPLGAHLSLKQPVPEFPRNAAQDITARLENQGRI